MPRKNLPPEIPIEALNAIEEKPSRGRRGAKPKNIVDAKFIATAKKLAGRGLTHMQMYSYFGVKHATWFNYLADYPELKAAVHRGRSKMISYVAGKLLQLCKKGNLKAIIFFLQNQAYFGMEKFDEDGKLLTPDQKMPSALQQLTQGDPITAARIYQEFMKGS